MSKYSDLELVGMLNSYGDFTDSLKDFRNASKGSATEYRAALEILEIYLPACRDRIFTDLQVQLSGLKDVASLEKRCNEAIDNFKGL